MAPVYAMPRMLDRAGLSLTDFDLYEIHEAFAAQVLCTLRAWADPVFCRERLGRDAPLGEIDLERLNVNGGSLAAGHPFAATGGGGVRGPGPRAARRRPGGGGRPTSPGRRATRSPPPAGGSSAAWPGRCTSAARGAASSASARPAARASSPCSRSPPTEERTDAHRHVRTDRQLARRALRRAARRVAAAGP